MSENKEIETPYEMTLSLNVLNHLGLHLYSNVPAVLSEIVANAWDADSENVDINIDTANGFIVITDDGHGMTQEDINQKYLMVGYRRREKLEGRYTPKFNRAVMGRKGIGKLSLLSVAEEASIMTVKDGQKNGFKLVLSDIKNQIENNKDGKYYPLPIPIEEIDIESGTKIVLTSLKKRLHQSAPALRKRLARRFSVFGPEHNFTVKVNDRELSITDRDYYDKVEYVWLYDDKTNEYGQRMVSALDIFPRSNDLTIIEDENNEEVTKRNVVIKGWIGSVRIPSNLKGESDENLNRIVLIVRGKLAQEDVLSDFSEGGIFASYLIGEIEADFLDDDDKEDVATSNRQKVIEDDPRYLALKDFIYQELKFIQSQWTDLRNQRGVEEALEHPAIRDWFEYLDGDDKRRAQKLFGKINALTIETLEDRKRLYKYSVMAFESLRYKGNLDALNVVSAENVHDLIPLFEAMDDIEATLYHQIVRQRLSIINLLREKVTEDAKERVLQEHLFNHLWLLDPSWERATENPHMEQSLKTIFEGIDAGLSEEERLGRVDIKYRTASGKHIIVELKRAGRKVDTGELINQIIKYRGALEKLLAASGRAYEPSEFICVLGTRPSDWSSQSMEDASKSALERYDARIILYDELIDSSYESYREFLAESKKAGRVSELIERIEQEDFMLPVATSGTAFPKTLKTETLAETRTFAPPEKTDG